MKTLYNFLFWLPYPAAVVYHFVLGAFLCGLFGALFLGWDGYGQAEVTVSIAWGLIVCMAAFALFVLHNKPKL